jgi:hypothetical protein
MPSPEFGAGPGELPAMAAPELIPINTIITKTFIHFFIVRSPLIVVDAGITVVLLFF